MRSEFKGIFSPVSVSVSSLEVRVVSVSVQKIHDTATLFVTNYINYLFDKSLICSLFMHQSSEMSLPTLNHPSVIFPLSYGVLGGILLLVQYLLIFCY